MDRRQRVKIGQSTSEWLDIWGTVPQGTLIGVLCFIDLINDLTTTSRTIKYVDDTTLYHITNDPSDAALQRAVSAAISWSRDNNMNINASKTKEMLVSFAKEDPSVPKIIIDGDEVKRV